MFKKISIVSFAAYAMASLALPALAQTTPTNSAPTNGAPTNAAPTNASGERPAMTVDSACMQNAVDKRDSAVLTAFGAYSDAVKSALSTRKNALKAAWGLTDRKARRDALRAAWKDWMDAVRKDVKDLRNAKRAAWTQFYQDRRTCHGTGEGEQGEGTDSQL